MGSLAIICLTETWISIDDTDTFLLCNEAYYNICLHPCIYGRGCGIGILVHKDLPSSSISHTSLSFSDVFLVHLIFNLINFA